MPELPDIELYLAGLRERVVGRLVWRVRVLDPFIVRSVEPPIDSLVGQVVEEAHRLGKRVVIGFPGDLFFVVHLMIAGRFQWLVGAKAANSRPGGRIGRLAIDFEDGTLVLTEASKKRRAGVWVVRGSEGLDGHDPGGVEPLLVTLGAFAAALNRVNRTLKRALTDPASFSGIGNAYSDEILFRARLSPVRLTSSLTTDEVERLYRATQSTLADWTERLQAEFAGRFPGPGEVTAFRPDFCVHGRYGEPCRVCGAKIQRIQYADRETDYCARCQNEGRVLADRSLSRLLKDDWPRTLDDD